MGTSPAKSSRMKGVQVGGRGEPGVGEQWLCIRQVKTVLRTTVRTELIQSHRIVGNGTSSLGFGLCRSGLESPALPLVS